MFMSALIKTTVLHELPKVDAAPVTAGKMPYGVAIALGTFIYVVLEHGGRHEFPEVFLTRQSGRDGNASGYRAGGNRSA